jgi:hypothetical protein
MSEHGMILLSLVVDLRKSPQSLSARLGCEIALGAGEHLVPDHELLDVR